MGSIFSVSGKPKELDDRAPKAPKPSVDDVVEELGIAWLCSITGKPKDPKLSVDDDDGAPKDPKPTVNEVVEEIAIAWLCFITGAPKDPKPAAPPFTLSENPKETKEPEPKAPN